MRYTTPPQAKSPPGEIEQLVERILSSRQITRHDQNMLLSLSSASSFSVSDREQLLVNRVYELLSKGFIQVMD